MLKCVISGFQSGSDIAGVKAAKLVGLSTGGWMPLGWRTEDGPRPEYASLYGAKEHPSPDWGPRTVANVKSSDATLLFVSGKAKRSPGSDLTRKACADLKRPMLEIPVWSVPDRVPKVAKVAEMIRGAGFKVVNVAGTRASSDPAVAGVPGSGIEDFVFTYCVCLFEILKGD